jgi:hypothetical protein
MTTVYEQIVRELAESDPKERTRDGDFCMYCRGEIDGLGQGDHLPECLWLRAEQAVEVGETAKARANPVDKDPVTGNTGSQKGPE